MADQNEGINQDATLRRTLADYAKPSVKGAQPSVVRPKVEKNNFMIPTSIITMIQDSVKFEGVPEEDPNAHLALFLEVCDTFKIEGVSEDAIKLRLFPFSLQGQAKIWLNSLLAGSITTWEHMVEMFLLRYFPPSKTAMLRNNIYAFLQDDEESLHEAWERFKELLRKCPHHGLELWQQVQTFYNGLNPQTRQTMDTISGGSFNNKTPEEAIGLLEELAMNNYQWPNTRSTSPMYSQRLYQADAKTVLAAQNKPYSKGNNPNFLKKFNDGIVNPPESRVAEAGGSAQLEKKHSLEDMMSQFLAMNETSLQENQNRFKENELEIRSQKEMILNIERHLGQIVSSLSERQQVSQPKLHGEESKRTSEGGYIEE